MKFVREQFFLAAAAQNLKRLVRYLTQPTTPHRGSHHLTEVSQENGDNRSRKEIRSTPFFNTHRRFHSLTRTGLPPGILRQLRQNRRRSSG
jgi:hypothetical protein